MNDFLRPSLSATQPKVAYPGNIPTRFSVTRSFVVSITLKPRPPSVIGRERYGGSHVNRPHHANMPKKFNMRSAMVVLRYFLRKISVNPIGGTSETCELFLDFHISDSGTLRRIQSVTTAGNIPTKKTYRQLKCRSINPATNAAAA